MNTTAFWWVWATSAAILSSLISQPTALLGLSLGTALLVRQFATSQSDLQHFRWMLRIAFWLAVVRFSFQILLGTQMGNQVLFELPEIHMPEFLAGLRIGGVVTLLSLEYGAMQALRLAALVIIFGGVSAIASPRKLLLLSPDKFQRLQLFASLTLNFLPQLTQDAERLLRANRWRGQKSNRILQLSRNLIPLTETVLDRAINQGAALAVRTPTATVKSQPKSTSRGYFVLFGLVGIYWATTSDAATAIIGIALVATVWLWQTSRLRKFITAVSMMSFWIAASPLVLLVAISLIDLNFQLFDFANPAFDFQKVLVEATVLSSLLLLALISGGQRASN